MTLFNFSQVILDPSLGNLEVPLEKWRQGIVLTNRKQVPGKELWEWPLADLSRDMPVVTIIGMDTSSGVYLFLPIPGRNLFIFMISIIELPYSWSPAPGIHYCMDFAGKWYVERADRIECKLRNSDIMLLTPWKYTSKLMVHDLNDRNVRLNFKAHVSTNGVETADSTNMSMTFIFYAPRTDEVMKCRE